MKDQIEVEQSHSTSGPGLTALALYALPPYLQAGALSEAFFSQLGPNSNFGAQFAQTMLVKCSDAPS
jgi:hypothetical protein